MKYNELHDFAHGETIQHATKRINKHFHSEFGPEDDVHGLTTQEIIRRFEKNCYKQGKNREKNRMVCIDGSYASTLAFYHALRKCDKNDHLILICIRHTRHGNVGYSLATRWRLMKASKLILVEHDEHLKKIGQNYTILYPEMREKLADCISFWAKKMYVKEIYIGGASNRFLSKLSKKCTSILVQNITPSRNLM